MQAQRGFTVVELLVTLTILVIVLGIGVPSYTNYIARKRVEGAFNELQTDFQFARSEAVSRNVPVRLTFGSGCYVIHTQLAVGASSWTCTQTAASTTTDPMAIELRTLQLPLGSSAQFDSSDLPAWIEFEPLRGGAARDTGGTTRWVNVISSAGPWQMRVAFALTGQVQGCSPGGTVKGYAPC